MSHMQSTDPMDPKMPSSQRSPARRQSGSGRLRNPPTTSNSAPQSSSTQYQEHDPRQRFDEPYPNPPTHPQSSTYPSQQTGEPANPRSRSREPANTYHTPHATRHSANLRQQFSVADPEAEPQRSTRINPDQSTASGAPTQPFPPIAYYQTGPYDPEQRFSRSSTVQDLPSRNPSDAQKPTRTTSQRQPGQPELGRLSTASTAAGRQPAHDPDDPDDSHDPDDSDDAIQPVRDPSDEPVTLEVFRALVGIPQKGSEPLPLDSTRRAAAGDSPVTPKTPYDKLSASQVVPLAISEPARVRHPRSWRRYLLNILTFGLRHEEKDAELSTSIYYSVLKQQKVNHRLYILYDVLTYTCMILQVIIAAVLIIVGALPGSYHIPVAVLGGVTGVLTGILGLVKGQGFPNRYIQYLDSLRKVREDIEFTERELRARRRIITYSDVIKLRTAYEQVRDDQSKNRPDFWSTGLDAKAGTASVGRPATSSKQNSKPKSAGAMV
jgi:hypothetical protein